VREKEAGNGPGKAKNRPDGALNFKMRKLTKEPRQGRGIQAAGGGVFQQPAKASEVFHRSK